MDKHERFIYIGQLTIRSSPKDAPTVKVADIYDHLSQMKSFIDISNIDDTRQFTLGQFKLKKEYAVFLFHARDERIADQIQQDKKTKKSRPFPKTKNEAPAHSAHMVVSLPPIGTNSTTFSFALENVSYVSRTAILEYLIELFKSEFSDTYTPAKKNSKDKPKERDCRPYVEMDGNIANTFDDAFHKKGVVLDELVVTNASASKIFDEETAIKSVNETLTMKLAPQITGNIAERTLKFVYNKYKGSQSQIKVKVTPPSERSKVTPLDMTREDIMHQAFIFQEKVSVEDELNVFESEIRTDLVEKMIEKL